jgi:hypothetical protein
MFEKHAVFKAPEDENIKIWRYMDFSKFRDSKKCLSIIDDLFLKIDNGKGLPSLRELSELAEPKKESDMGKIKKKTQKLLSF